MLRSIIILNFILGFCSNLHSQTFISIDNTYSIKKTFSKNSDTRLTKESHFLKSRRQQTVLSIGGGFVFQPNHKPNAFLFSADLIPVISKHIYLDLKVDAMPQGQSYVVLLNCIPEYKFQLSRDGKYAAYLGSGLTIYTFPKRHMGLDASVMTQAKFEYSLSNFFINAELRKPIYFYSDSGHWDFIMNMNVGFKLDLELTKN